MDGALAATSSNFAHLPILKPGQKSPFELVVSSPPSAANYKLETTWRVTTERGYTDIDITDVSALVDTEGQYRLTGKIRNAGDKPIAMVIVVGSFYDESGKVAATGFTMADTVPLGIGQVSSFTMMVNAVVSASIKSYSIQAQAFQGQQ